MPLGDTLGARATADLADIAPVAEQDITYCQYQNTTGGNASLGIAATSNHLETAAKAQVRELTLQDVQLSGGAYKVGDTDFAIRRTAVDPRDQITWAGVRWRILERRPVVVSGTTVLQRLRCRKI